MLSRDPFYNALQKNCIISSLQRIVNMIQINLVLADCILSGCGPDRNILNSTDRLNFAQKSRKTIQISEAINLCCSCLSTGLR